MVWESLTNGEMVTPYGYSVVMSGVHIVDICKVTVISSQQLNTLPDWLHPVKLDSLAALNCSYRIRNPLPDFYFCIWWCVV